MALSPVLFKGIFGMKSILGLAGSTQSIFFIFDWNPNLELPWSVRCNSCQSRGILNEHAGIGHRKPYPWKFDEIVITLRYSISSYAYKVSMWTVIEHEIFSVLMYNFVVLAIYWRKHLEWVAVIIFCCVADVKLL